MGSDFNPGRTVIPDLDVDSGTISVDETNNRVGVGTTSPAATLDVIGIGSFAGAEASLSQGVIQVGVDSGGDPGGELMYHTDDYVGIRCADSGAISLAVKPDGKVGIGTTSPAATLDVVGSFRTGLVTLTGDTSITAATHAGRILLLGEVGGNASLTATLPAATGTGDRYKFVVSVVNTSNYAIKVVGDDIMQGHIVTDSTGDAAAAEVINWKTAGDSDTIGLNATTTGGAQIGDWVELIDIASNTWMVYGYTTTSGAEATPFSATVS